MMIIAIPHHNYAMRPSPNFESGGLFIRVYQYFGDSGHCSRRSGLPYYCCPRPPVSLLLNVMIVAVYMISVWTANKTLEYFQYVTWVMTATHVGIWGADCHRISRRQRWEQLMGLVVFRKTQTVPACLPFGRLQLLLQRADCSVYVELFGGRSSHLVVVTLDVRVQKAQAPKRDGY